MLAKIAPKDTYAQCIKEKFGGLRCYINKANEEYWKIDRKMEELSFKTCEQCGTMDNVECKPTENTYWIRTLCENCRNGN